MRLTEAGDMARGLRSLHPWAPVRVRVELEGLGVVVEDCYFELTESATQPELVAAVRAEDLLGPRELAAVRRLVERRRGVAGDGGGRVAG